VRFADVHWSCPLVSIGGTGRLAVSPRRGAHLVFRLYS